MEILRDLESLVDSLCLDIDASFIVEPLCSMFLRPTGPLV